MEEITADKTLRVEISENGKQWTPIQLPIREQKTAYIRIKNISEEEVAVDFNQLSVSRILTSVEVKAEASTNMSQYQSYSINNVSMEIPRHSFGAAKHKPQAIIFFSPTLRLSPFTR